MSQCPDDVINAERHVRKMEEKLDEAKEATKAAKLDHEAALDHLVKTIRKYAETK